MTEKRMAPAGFEHIVFGRQDPRASSPARTVAAIANDLSVAVFPVRTFAESVVYNFARCIKMLYHVDCPTL